MVPAVMRLMTEAGITISIALIMQPAALAAQQLAPAPVPPQSAEARPPGDGHAPSDGSRAGDTIAIARERYAAAEYEEALAVLDKLNPEEADTPTRVEAEQYRALCLLALDRQDDARQAIVQLILLEPTYDVARLNVSPSVKKRFEDVRAQLLPGMARQEYEAGKAAFDRKAYAEATPHLRNAVALSDAAAKSGAGDPARDINTLALGFLDLAAANSAPREPRAASDGAAPAANGAATNGTAAEPPATPAPVRHVPVVVEPEPLQQRVPAISPQLRQLASAHDGEIELTVDETGRVTSAVMRKPIYPIYDTLLLQAARNWRYRPGTVDGKPATRTVTVAVRAE